MKLTATSVLAFLTAGMMTQAAPFNNYGVISSPTNITASTFNNFGTIDFSLLFSFTNFTAKVVPISAKPYDTYGTKYFTNASSGRMFGAPGFRFADVTPRTIVAAKGFVNQGVVNCVDTPVGISIYDVTQNAGGIIVPNENQLIPSQLDIDADNVTSSGTLAVGDGGRMSITGRNVDLSYGILTAGNLVPTNAVSEEESLAAEDYVLAGGKLYTLDATGVYDLLWGATNGWQNVPVRNFVIPQGDGLYEAILPVPPGTTNRGGFFFTEGDMVGVNLSAFVYEYGLPAGQTTNIYYNVVLVDTNFADPDTSVTVGFAPGLQGANWVPPQPNTGDPNGIPDLVTFTENIVDPITGSTVQNSIYLEDDGATLNPILLAQNAAYTAAYSRPDAFEITTTQPFIVNDFVPANTTFDPGEIYTSNEMSTVISLTNAIYAAQIGRNPENLSGVFSDLTGAFGGVTGTESFPDIPDITNAPGRVTINARNLNLHDMKLRAEGLLTINATNVTGLPRAFEYGTADMSLGALTNSLLVSNLVPVVFSQLRGDLEAWSGNWVNMQTNATATNTIHTHLLMIVDTLSAKYTPTIRKFQTKSTNIVVQDNVQVIGSATFNTRNLTVNSTLHLTQGAADLKPKGTPNLRNLLVTTNGNFLVDSLLDIGFNINKPVGATSPIGRTYTVTSITNQGLISATAPTLQARNIENDGTIAAINGGSVILSANRIELGVATGAPNSITTGGELTLSANFIEETNTTIDADQLVITPVQELTDFTAGTPGVNGPTVNFWAVTNRLALTRRAKTGDLYGTEIELLAKDGPPTTVTWAGVDQGDSLSGFENNGVIGHLVLDRLTNTAVMQFFAAGKRSAMYVNYLELADASFTNYQNNMYIDPHLTIYFASANVPPFKLTAIYPNLVYASNTVAEAGGTPDLLARRGALGAVGGGKAGVAAPGGAAPGVYNGLFAPQSGVTARNSGYFTMTLAANGAFSGRLLMGTAATSFSSRLDQDGAATFNAGGMTVSLETDASGEVIGEVSGAGWASDLNGAFAPVWTAKMPAPQAGSFALALSGAAAGPAQESFGTLHVGATGALTVAGKLADGAAFSQAARLTEDGQWPFYAVSPSGKDVVMGWLTFAEDSGGFSGNVTWIRQPGAGTSYPAGFTVNVPAVGTATGAVAGGKASVTSQ